MNTLSLKQWDMVHGLRVKESFEDNGVLGGNDSEGLVGGDKVIGQLARARRRNPGLTDEPFVDRHRRGRRGFHEPLGHVFTEA